MLTGICHHQGMADLLDILIPVAAVIAAIAVALLLAWILRKILVRPFRKVPSIRDTSLGARNPLRVGLAIIAVRVALGITVGHAWWFPSVDRVLVFALIGAAAWLAIAVLVIIEAGLLAANRRASKDNRRYRRLKTQVILGRRIVSALIITLAIGAVLLTIPEVRALGAGILASAGLISIVAGLAVQSSLANVFAGVQLAFTDAIRVDDIVQVEERLGTVEEVTLTYVVVRVWDERRLILPSTYFTTTPFENWTRKNAELLGTVEFDLDWTVPVESLRAQLAAVLGATDLWDQRSGKLQVTSAINSMVRVRVLVSARDSDALWELRCLVRESLVSFLQATHPHALPRNRWEPVQPDAAPYGSNGGEPG